MFSTNYGFILHRFRDIWFQRKYDFEMINSLSNLGLLKVLESGTIR